MIPEYFETIGPASAAFFNEAWRRCSKEGWCDEFDGKEYQRIFLEWIQAGKPYDVWMFICLGANKGFRLN